MTLDSSASVMDVRGLTRVLSDGYSKAHGLLSSLKTLGFPFCEIETRIVEKFLLQRDM